jgi:multidrug efflux pump subunit AcrA (membrane-fusion protein)
MATIIHPDEVQSTTPPLQTETPAPTPCRSVDVWARLFNTLPTAAVIILLTGLALWGHSNDWKLPKFSSFRENVATEKVVWCEEHGVPEAQCVECDPSLMPKGPDYGWCAEHGVHNCPLHHPDVAQTKEQPTISAADFDRTAAALALVERKPNNSACKTYQARIQFASLDAMKKAGVDVELVERQHMTESIPANGEISYDATRIANVSPRVAGSMWRVQKNVGDKVRAGEILAFVDAQAIGQAKGELIDSLVQENLHRKTVDRLSGLGGSVVAGRKVIEAEADLEKAKVRTLAAQQTLANLGLTIDLDKLRQLSHEAQLQQLRRLGFDDVDGIEGEAGLTTANLLPVRSPMDGVIVKQEVVAGEVVDTSRVLFQVADTSRMWVTLNVPLEKAELLSLGLPVRFQPDGSGKTVTGQISWISTAVDSQTRMIQVRAELPNPDGRLRDETFGAGHIILREEPEAIVVPTDAVHWEGCCQLVFVRDKHFFDSPDSYKVFHVRTVRVGAKTDKFSEIIAGVLPGEVVATKGSDVLRSQLLKNNLGEGCTCVE